MSNGKRRIPEQDKVRFWHALSSGMTIREAAHLAGIHYNTALNWVRKRDVLAANKELAEFDEKTKGSKKSGKTTVQIAQDIADSMGSPPVVPTHLLCERAQRGLVDFDYFRRVYLGRVPSPWQVEAAYKIVEYLESDDKEFVVLNCPPGAGKSTLFHDVAVWCIVRNRKIRILYGSISEKLAKQYSRRIRETLERVTPLEPNPEDVKRGLAMNAEASLTMDYGRFKPAALGALWRADEFMVEQVDQRGMDNKEPTVSAYGIDSEFIGHRADLCLFDDVASPENAKESASRDKLLERWDSMAEARLDPAGLLAVIGQRLGPGDLYAHCLAKVTYEEFDDDYDGSDVTQKPTEDKEPVKKHKYHQLIYKSYYEELDTGPASRRKDAKPWPEGPLLDPQRLSWKDLSYIRHNNPQKFETVYQQQDINTDAYLIQRVWATGGLGPDGVLYPGCVDNDRQPGFIPPGLTPPIISIASVDPSPTQFWAIQWWIYQPETNLRYLIDMERAKLTAEDLLGYTVSTGEYSGVMDEWQERSWNMGYPISHWIVEINAAQRFLLAHDFVRRWQALHGVNVVPHTTSRNKLDESLGIEALLPPLWRSGAVRLPTMRGSWKTLALVDEMCSWTREKKNGTDTVMAHWFAELHMPQLIAPEAPPQLWRPSWLVQKYV
jgi:hypothetical protein